MMRIKYDKAIDSPVILKPFILSFPFSSLPSCVILSGQHYTPAWNNGHSLIRNDTPLPQSLHFKKNSLTKLHFKSYNHFISYKSPYLCGRLIFHQCKLYKIAYHNCSVPVWQWEFFSFYTSQDFSRKRTTSRLTTTRKSYQYSRIFCASFLGFISKIPVILPSKILYPLVPTTPEITQSQWKCDCWL